MRTCKVTRVELHHQQQAREHEIARGSSTARAPVLLAVDLLTKTSAYPLEENESYLLLR